MKATVLIAGKKQPYCLFTLLAALIFLFCSSCGPTLYIPNTINAPLLGEKGDFKASIGGNGFAPGPNTELQGAYALTDKMAVMANASLMSGRRIEPQSSDRHHLVEGAVGAYKAFWPNKRQHRVGRAELFGGAGLGWAEDNDGQLGNTARYHYRGAYQRLFAQPSLGIRTRIIDVAFSSRLAWVHFSNFEHREEGAFIERGQFSFATLEPVLTLALGYKYVKLYWQVGGITPFHNAAHYYRVTSDYWGGHSNAGLVFSPWKEKPVAVPAVGLEAAPTPPGEPGGLEPAALVEPSALSGADAGKEPEGAAPPLPTLAPTLVVGVKTRQVSICIRDNGSPDGDVVSASFRGSYVLPETELGKKPCCFELSLAPGEDNALLIHSISSGRFKPNTILVQIGRGKEEQRHLLQLKEGVTEQIRIQWHK